MSARQPEATARKQRLGRTETLTKQKVLEQQSLDDDRAAARSGEAAVSAAQGQVTAADAAIQVAETQQRGAVSSSEAAQATIARIKADLDECALKAPRTGRVQYRVTQVREVLGVGGKVLNQDSISA